MKKSFTEVIIIGAGPAGLTAAYELAKRQTRSVILEKDRVVGGISRTVKYKGYRFDMGGHRFFTKVDRAMDMWREVLGGDFLRRPRLSRIYYKKKFFSYPIKPFDVLNKLGLWETFLAGCSFLYAKLNKRPREESFEDYIINNFGERLYRTFFKSYTEKVWGIPCTEIRAEWAAQRIKGLSFGGLVRAALFGNRGNKIKTLIEEFYYPRFGPGMMWERTKKLVEDSGYGKVRFAIEVVSVLRADKKITGVRIRNEEGEEEIIECNALVSSMPISELLFLLDPPVSSELREAAQGLHYRDFILVALILNHRDMFSDNWIYVHDPGVSMGRIENFKNWSPEMVSNPNTTCLGLEYYCFKNDHVWNMSDKELIRLGAEELEKIGLAKKRDVLDGAVARMEKTYPVYDSSYERVMPTVREEIKKFKNLYPVGRNGMHKYNNQDHAMLTAMLSVENIFGARHDIWNVNVERVYHEEIEKGDGENQ
ncbi:NAD(P)/FAD-dependent oxidoreductase [Patescibacteria group bacterium]|nr:MAG: NAD(P)/FAD-dependent oxidoreductase [Patescibacteria group bacterium]